MFGSSRVMEILMGGRSLTRQGPETPVMSSVALPVTALCADILTVWGVLQKHPPCHLCWEWGWLLLASAA
ncbi:hypothetical protein ACOMHN_056974 [Nucella lapillus]